MTTNAKWRGLPEAEWGRWANAFASDRSSVKVAASCPVCGEEGLRRYYGKPTDEPKLVCGVNYRGRGAVWEWCIECRTYEHASGLVPKVWVAPEIDVQEYYLKPSPVGLAEAIEAWLG